MVALVGGGLLAQGFRPDSDAEALLKRVAENCASKPHLEVTAYIRELSVEALPDAESTTPTYRVSNAQYGRLVLTRRSPDDWRIVSQWEHVIRGEAQPSKTLVFGKIGDGDSNLLLLNPTTKKTSRISLPEGMFKQEVNERIGHKGAFDALFRLLFKGEGERSNWAVFHGSAAELKIEGTEEVDGVWLTRMVTGWPSSEVTRLWIDSESLRLVRILKTPGEPYGGMHRPVELKETLYRYDFTKGTADADFDLEAGWALATPNIASAAGFSPSTELFAKLTSGGRIKPETPVAKVPKTPNDPKTPPATVRAKPPGERDSAPTQPLRPGEAPVAGAPSTPGGNRSATTPKTPAPVEAQSLNAEQMAAVVLVEGEGGVGSGFITKIRDLPFVVTNVHVIGGNEKLRVTTLTGAKVEVGATHAAIGRDLAIMRIEGTLPTAFLTLAANPLQSAKIGDKVVVVGNRRGGGVATQVSGVVQGVGPDKIEVDAAFQPGNSGSPIVHVESGEVIGLAAYSQTRRLDMLDGVPAKSGSNDESEDAKMEQRWFGYRIDGVSGWQNIDIARWRQQTRRIEAFRKDSEALYYALLGKFNQTSQSPSVHSVVERFQQRFERAGSGQVQAAQDVVEYFRSLRALTENGKKELRDGDYYDYFRSSLYWETSITEQLRTREQIAKYLEQATENTSAFLSRLRN